ncbi:MAG: penicillin-binding protein 2 [Burkholderiaceae bacterium]|nr:MAG: penicillin-binding protein 2 [Burkholderiaceae bacterium]
MRSIRYTSSPLLAAKTPGWRSKFVLGALAVGFLALTARAAYVQVFDSAFFKHQGDVRFVRTLDLPASRGRIFDRNGVLLASSVEAPSIWAAPDDLNASDAQLRQLAKLLDMPLAALNDKLADRAKSFVWLKRQVDLDVARRIATLKIPGVHEQKAYKREYPEGQAVAQVVGFAGVENHGQEGAELEFDSRLAGKAGSRKVIKDRMGHVVEVVGEEKPPVDGQDIQLSIDSRIQFYAFEKLREMVTEHHAKSGSAVVLDPRTGEILALANYPSYSPNDRGDLSGSDLRNRALTDTFEPGSTIKPFTIAMALQAGKVTPTTLIQTAPGSYKLDRFTIRDTHDYGTLTVAGVIQKSSNIGALKIGTRLQPQYMWDTYQALGYGRKPDIAFPGAASGVVHYWKSWRPVEQATMSYGYGISVSLLQLAHAYTVFARDGDIIPLTLLRKPDGTRTPGVRVFSEKTTREVRAMLGLVTKPGGTAPLAQTVGYTTGGKTGTAREQAGRGYGNKYRASFVGMAPLDDPRVIMAVTISAPQGGVYYGGALAGPVFSAVVGRALRFMGVRPDKEVKPEIVASEGPEGKS